MRLNKTRLAAAGAAAALGISLAVAPTATAATKTITIWADEQRGPQLSQFLNNNTKLVPGYTIKIKIFTALTALQGAWDKASAASGPDILTGPASMAAAGGKSGKLVALTYPPAVKKGFATAALSAMSYKGRVYGVPLDVDTTAFLWNKKLFGATAPATFGDMVDWYLANKTSKNLKGGFCAFEGTWGSHPVLTALGGGAWAYKGTVPDYNTVLLNSAAFKANVKRYLVGADGKSNGFFQWDGCGDAFKAGTIPFANTGAWNFDSISSAGIDYGIGAVPGVTAKAKGAQWVNYSGAYLTAYASKHGVDAGARSLLLNWFASKEGQVQMSLASQRPPAQNGAAAVMANPKTKAVAQAAATGTPQISPVLDDKAGGNNWYDVLGATFTSLFTKGESVDTTLDNAAAILKKNFADAATQL